MSEAQQTFLVVALVGLCFAIYGGTIWRIRTPIAPGEKRTQTRVGVDGGAELICVLGVLGVLVGGIGWIIVQLI